MGIFEVWGAAIDFNECDVDLEHIAIKLVSDVVNSFLILQISDHFKGSSFLSCSFCSAALGIVCNNLEESLF